MSTRERPCFDVWVCEGRLCTANGADGVRDRALVVLGALPAEEQKRVRLLRGGCFGLCELGANVVVRRWASLGRLPDPSVDRLQVTGKANETIYAKTTPEDVARLMACHLENDAPLEEATLRAREVEVDAGSTTARNIRRLRRRWVASDRRSSS